MHWRSLVVVTMVASLVPVGSAAAQPAEDEVTAPDGTEATEAPEGAVEGPAEAPAPAAPLGNVPPPPVLVEPEYTGKGLIGAAIGLTAFSWVARFTSLGLTAGTGDCTGSDCDGKYTTAIALLYVAPISQFVATGLVIPGGLMKGRHDGWRRVTTGKPERNGKGYVVAGGVMFGVFTAVSIALRPVYLALAVNCVVDTIEGTDTECGGVGGYVGYNVGVALSDAGSTAGAGLMSYGLGYRGYMRRHGAQLGVAPFGSRGAYGLSLTARF